MFSEHASPEGFEPRRDFSSRACGAANGFPTATRIGADLEVVETFDYVLSSPDLKLRDAEVVWPSEGSDREGLLDDVQTASDHRLVWADIETGKQGRGWGWGR